MKGLFEGIVTGSETWPARGDRKERKVTSVSLGPGSEIRVDGNGYQVGEPVLVVADVRTGKDGGSYVQGECELHRRPASLKLGDVVQGALRALNAQSPGAGGAQGSR